MGSNFSNQNQITAGYKTSAAVRTPGPRNDGANRSFMSPPRMMSPPPSVQASTISHTQSTRMPMSYNGDTQMQHYFNQPGRYPHSWQGARQQAPTPPNQNMPQAGQNVSQSTQMARASQFGIRQQQMPQIPTQVPKPSQQLLQPQFAQNSVQLNQQPLPQMHNLPPASVNNQEAGSMLSNPPVSISMPAPNDFDIDSLLSDPVDGTSSFMQQLQGESPSANSILSSSMFSSLPEPTVSNTVISMAMDTSATAKPSQMPLPEVPADPTAVPSTSNRPGINANIVKSFDSSNLPNVPGPNTSFNDSEEDKLDSGEITLESNEQDLLKAASSLPIPFADAVPSSASAVTSEVNEPLNTFSVSQTPAVSTSTPILPIQPVTAPMSDSIPVPSSTAGPLIATAVAPVTSSEPSEVERRPSFDVSAQSGGSAAVTTAPSVVASSSTFSSTTTIVSTSLTTAAVPSLTTSAVPTTPTPSVSLPSTVPGSMPSAVQPGHPMSSVAGPYPVSAPGMGHPRSSTEVHRPMMGESQTYMRPPMMVSLCNLTRCLQHKTFQQYCFNIST